jgi:site-specific recombinase XerD
MKKSEKSSQKSAPKSGEKSKSLRKGSVDFPYAIRSFLGYLEGTQKALHTIKNYRLDLLAFQSFLLESGSKKSLDAIDASDLESYQNHLRGLGLKTNTRRRKLMTLRKFLSYLAGRKKIPVDLGRKLPTPHKMERIPVTVSATVLLQAIEKLPQDTELDMRNRALLWTLLETGCLISEAAKVRFEDFHSLKNESKSSLKSDAKSDLKNNLKGDLKSDLKSDSKNNTTGDTATLEFHGKNARSIAITANLYHAIQSLKQKRKGDSPWIFLGFNKFGSLGAAISPRGIELLVKAYASKLGFPEIVPRTFRHSIVLSWLQNGFTEASIQQRLGLKSAYAFRAFASSVERTKDS